MTIPYTRTNPIYRFVTTPRRPLIPEELSFPRRIRKIGFVWVRFSIARPRENHALYRSAILKAMAYRLERGESVISGLKRVISEEIDSAGDQLSGEERKVPSPNRETSRTTGADAARFARVPQKRKGRCPAPPNDEGTLHSGGADATRFARVPEKKLNRDEAIHDARKSIKKVRAILRLVREEMGESFRKENARLRDIAGRLSEFRDAFAIIETFDDLKTRYKKELGRVTLRAMRAGLAKRRNESGREENVIVVLGAAAAALRRTARRVKSWHFGADELKSGTGYAAIAPGLEAAYSNGRKALARARKNPTPENFHELRKRVKDTWYHMRLLECLWSEVIVAYEKSLKDLETWLGNDHNLVVLQDVIALEPAFFGKEKDIQLAFDLIARYQKELRGEAIPLAERIYEEKPREFTRRMKHLWHTWQSEANSPDPSGNRTAA